MLRTALFFLLLSGSISGMANPLHRLPAEKIITITVNEHGLAIIGRDTLTMDELVIEIQTRLWKSWLGTGKMYDSLKLDFAQGVTSEVQIAAIKSLHEAQQRALTELCLQKHKKRFEELDSHQQEKIQKQFPVLFQKEFQ